MAANNAGILARAAAAARRRDVTIPVDLNGGRTRNTGLERELPDLATPAPGGLAALDFLGLSGLARGVFAFREPMRWRVESGKGVVAELWHGT